MNSGGSGVGAISKSNMGLGQDHRQFREIQKGRQGYKRGHRYGQEGRYDGGILCKFSAGHSYFKTK